MKTVKEKEFWVEFNGRITSYVTAPNLETAIKRAKSEFPSHFEVTSSGLKGK